MFPRWFQWAAFIKSVVLSQAAGRDLVVALQNNRCSVSVLFAIAPVTNYHKFSTQNSTNNLYIQFWMSKVQNESLWMNLKMSARLCSLLQGPGEIPLPCLLWLLEATCIPWRVAGWLPSSISKACRATCGVESFSHCTTLTPTHLLPFLHHV